MILQPIDLNFLLYTLDLRFLFYLSVSVDLFAMN